MSIGYGIAHSMESVDPRFVWHEPHEAQWSVPESGLLFRAALLIKDYWSMASQPFLVSSSPQFCRWRVPRRHLDCPTRTYQETAALEPPRPPVPAQPGCRVLVFLLAHPALEDRPSVPVPQVDFRLGSQALYRSWAVLSPLCRRRVVRRPIAPPTFSTAIPAVFLLSVRWA